MPTLNKFAPNDWVARWHRDESNPAIEIAKIIATSPQPGRWTVKLANGKEAQWHDATIYRKLSGLPEAASMTNRQIGALLIVRDLHALAETFKEGHFPIDVKALHLASLDLIMKGEYL